MSAFEETLGNGRLGAEILARVARERFTGALAWVVGDKTRSIVFSGGRPEVVGDSDGRESTSKQQVVAVVRALAISDVGVCRFEVGNRGFTSTLGLDTLGETLIAVVRALPQPQLLALWRALRGSVLTPAPGFERFAKAVAQVGGTELELSAKGAPIGKLVVNVPIEVQRSWAALIALGGATVVSQSQANRPADSGSRPAKPVAPAERQELNLPEDPKARRAALEIEKAYRELGSKNHYDVLGITVGAGAGAETIREAYFAVARQWHSDRFAGLHLGKEWAEKAEAIFRAAGEAQRVLTDEKERSSYDFIIDRKAKGLPTDVNVILEAEGLFSKGQTLVRRGQAGAAEPMLRQAIEMNKGEPEFWAYFGYALFCAKGEESAVEAREALNKALKMRENLDAAHEFLGRIAHVQGNVADARKHLKMALDLNPKNVEAQRELRLLELRKTKNPESKGAFGGLLGGLLKKK